MAYQIWVAEGCWKEKLPFLDIPEHEKLCDNGNQGIVTVTETFLGNTTKPV
jgi:hypothetical protein